MARKQKVLSARRIYERHYRAKIMTERMVETVLPAVLHRGCSRP
jgi:hypothetical protein